MWDCRLIAILADAENDEASSGQPPNDPRQEGTNPSDKDELSRKEHDTAMRDLDDGDDGSDADSRDEIITTEDYHHFARSPLQERIKKGPRRALQQMAYTRLMEDRMGDFEKRLRTMENKPEAVAPPQGRVTRPTDMILGIKRMNFQEYKPTEPIQEPKGVVVPINHKRRHEFPGQLPYHLIDVVYSATHQQERLGKDQGSKPVAGPPDLAATSVAVPAQEPTTNDGQSVQPERIRINSTLLLNALRQITDCVVSFAKAPLGEELELQDQVILRPFKLLVTSEKEIRNEIEQLEKIHVHSDDDCNARATETAQSGDSRPPSQPITDPLHEIPQSSSQDHPSKPKDEKPRHSSINASVDGENEGTLPLESMRCLEELRVLRELLDKDLKPTFDLRKQIKDGVARSIAFQDLWHLFPLGDEIVSNDSNGQSQTYRILDVSGGRPFLCERYHAGMDAWESTSNGRDLPKFEILSYFYNSDGKELGACQQLHTIKSYDGNKAITSLPCFPIIYSKNSHGMKPRDFFVERGRRFIELTRKTDVVHKRYDGLTLAMDELREEVRPTLNSTNH